MSTIEEDDSTSGCLKIWSNFPDEIKNDPLLASFKRQYGTKFNKNTLEEEQPLRENHDDNPIASSSPTAGGISFQDRVFLDDNLTDKSNLNTQIGDEIPMSNLSSHSVLKDDQSNIHTIDISLTTDRQNQSSDTHVIDPGESKPWMSMMKISILFIFWLFFTVILLIKGETPDILKSISVPANNSKGFYILEDLIQKSIFLEFYGPFVSDQHENVSTNSITVWLEIVEFLKPVDIRNKTEIDLSHINSVKNASSTVWQLSVVSEDIIESVENSKLSNTIHLDLFDGESNPYKALRVMMSSNLQIVTPLTMKYNTKPVDVDLGLIYAAGLLILLYTLIIFEIVHRTFAAMLTSTLAISILAVLDHRPSTAELISWLDIETLLLLFSMMLLVGILSETGVFDYLAVYAYKLTGGEVWPLINCLCLFTAIFSSFLDNVTTILLMSPVTIRLCEVMGLNPVPILMSIVMFSNIGGTLTPVGDPPNVIIASNQNVQNAGIDFAVFTLHMALGIFLVMIQTYIHLRLYFRAKINLRQSKPIDDEDLRREISTWQHAALSLSNDSKDESLMKDILMKKVDYLQMLLKDKPDSGEARRNTFESTLRDLTEKYPIRNKVLLIKSTIAATFIISFFFLHSIPALQSLSLGWIALLGALLLLILADRNDIEVILSKVEWSTLLFFAALFVLMEALSKLGLITWIGKQTENIIMSVSENSRLAVAILIILWVSAVVSAFVDNIPITTMMIRIATDLGSNPELNIPLQPLVWALSFGACVGGNGSLFGASANVVCAGVAEKYGYRFTFVEFFKIGFPVMLGSISLITAYLMICHVVIEWH